MAWIRELARLNPGAGAKKNVYLKGMVSNHENASKEVL